MAAPGLDPWSHHAFGSALGRSCLLTPRDGAAGRLGEVQGSSTMFPNPFGLAEKGGEGWDMVPWATRGSTGQRGKEVMIQWRNKLSEQASQIPERLQTSLSDGRPVPFVPTAV